MFEIVEEAVQRLRMATGSLEPGCLTGADAARLVGRFAEAERLAAAGKAICAARVAETREWARGGHRSPASWLGSLTGESTGAAAGVIDTANRMKELPKVADAHRAGELSPAQAAEIAGAASADPSSESDLLAAARSRGMAGLRERCRKVRSDADESRRHAAIHRARRLRHWSEPDGTFRMDLRTTPHAGAKILARLAPFERRVFDDARRAGRRESHEAYAADALEAMAEAATLIDGTAGRAGPGIDDPPGGGSTGTDGTAIPADESTDDTGPSPAQPPVRPRAAPGPRAMVNVTVDYDALIRGDVKGGETCELTGLGPIPVAVARSLATDSILKVLVKKGVDVIAVAHAGRTVTAHQRTALVARDPECVVPGCQARYRLEIDHVDPWAATHLTTLDRLARLCHHHHFLKTHQGWRLRGSPGHWRFDPPADDQGFDFQDTG